MIRPLAGRCFFVLVFLIAILVCAPDVRAQDAIDVSNSAHYKILQGADIVREDLTPLSLEEARERYTRGDYTAASASLGDPTRPNSIESIELVYGPVWARVLVENTSGDPISARLDTRAGILNNVLYAHLVRADDSSRQIWRNNWLDEPYSEQSPQMRLRSSESFYLAPQEQAELWISYPYGFYIGEELWLIEEGDFVDRRTADAGYAAFFFGWRAAIIIAVFAFAVVLRSRVAMLYGLFSTALFAFFLENYGFTYTYLFRSYDLDQIWYVATGGIAFTFFGLMTREFLNARQLYPKLNRALLLVMGGGWIVGLIAMFSGPHPITFAMLIPVVLIFTMLCLGAAILGVRNKHSGAWLFFVATMMLFGSCLFGLLSWPPLYWISARLNTDVTHFTFSLDAFLFAGALVAQALSLRRERDEAHAAQIVALEAQAGLASRLDDVSADYDRAAALAEARRMTLAATSHDLKQPLLSLQMSLKDRADIAAVAESVSYFQTVIDRSLEEVRPSPPGQAPPRADLQPLDLAKLLNNIVTMFEDEAASKGLALSAATTSVQVMFEPVILMRILTNLVANAVKHTERGRILIGARRRGAEVSVEVYDTGHGIDPSHLSEIFEPYRSGTDSLGEGLGLAVVRDLAEANDLAVSVRSQLHRGSCFIVSGLPRHAL
ncbi:MAG: sensor histidine kinase [Pseudomonadota bacterium]